MTTPDRSRQEDLTPGWVRFAGLVGNAVRMPELRRTTAGAIAREVHRQRRMAYAVGAVAIVVGFLALLPGGMRPPQAGALLLIVTTMAGLALSRGLFEPELGHSRLEERLQASGAGAFLAVRTVALSIAGLLALVPLVLLLMIAYREEATLLPALLAVLRTLLIVVALSGWVQCRVGSVPSGLFLATLVLVPISGALSNMGGVLNPWQNPITVTWGGNVGNQTPPGFASLIPNLIVIILIARLCLMNASRRVWRLLRDS